MNCIKAAADPATKSTTNDVDLQKWRQKLANPKRFTRYTCNRRLSGAAPCEITRQACQICCQNMSNLSKSVKIKIITISQNRFCQFASANCSVSVAPCSEMQSVVCLPFFQLPTTERQSPNLWRLDWFQKSGSNSAAQPPTSPNSDPP